MTTLTGFRTFWFAGASVLACAASPQEQAGVTEHGLAFEVVSVKPSLPQNRGIIMIRPEPGGQRYVTRNASLRLMMQMVYQIADAQIANAPGWMETELYDVEAKAERPATTDQLHEMFRNMLADRFALKFHRVAKELQAYVLEVGKASARLQQSKSQDPIDIPIQPGAAGLIGTRVSMARLSRYFSIQLDKPLVDQTGLAGYYDFVIPTMNFDKFDSYKPIPGEEPVSVLKVREQVEQLGLRLESARKVPLEVFVIDQVERPKAN